MATESLARRAASAAVRAKQFTFYTKAEYYRDIVTRLSRARVGDRAALATMAFEPDDPGVANVLQALIVGAERGASVSLAVDAYIFLSQEKRGPGPLFFKSDLPQRMPKAFRRKLEVIEILRARGVTCTITNQPGRPFTSPVAGRSHIKYAIINDRLYIGGCNLTTERNIDLMVGWSDRKTADWLHDFAAKMVHAQGTAFLHGKDLEFSVDANSELLVDAGKRRQSVIFEKALELIDHAEEEILLTCQFFPNDITAKHLTAAHRRGVKVTIIYNQASKHQLPYNVLHSLVDMREHLRTPAALFASRLAKHHDYLHAKLLATEKSAIIGSHNFVSAGVNFGTAEIALLHRDPEFARNALSAIQRQV